MKLRILGVLVVLSFAVASAQQPATVTGRLVDPHNMVIENTGTSVHLKDASGKDYSAPVADNGSYRLTGVPAGTYDLTVPIISAMYNFLNKKGVVIKAGENKMDIHLEWGVNLGTIGDDPTQLANDMRARNPVMKGTTPRTPEGKVDFSGMWVSDSQRTGTGPMQAVPYQPWAAEVDEKLKKLGGDNRPDVYCLPFSALPFDAAWFPHKLVQTKTLLVDMAEFDTPGYRQVFIDDRPHPPKVWNPSWLGHSVGKWEGNDTLVIDTVGFNEMAGGVGVHTEKLHVIEKLTRPDLSHLNIEMIVEDSGALTKSWSKTAHFQLAPNEEILEFICAENNKDLLHLHEGTKGYRHRP
jgi:hypothetical protein